MKRLIQGLVVLVVTAFGVYASYSVSSAASNGAAIENLRGQLVNAIFANTDPSGCLQTSVFVTANSGVEQDIPSTTHYGTAAVDVYTYNTCTATTVVDATGQTSTLPADAFQVTNQLDQASLNLVITMSDLVSGHSFDVTVNVQWVGTGELTRAHDNTNQVYPGCHIINRWKGTGRDAVASGSVSEGLENLTPTASQYAEIGWVNDGFEIMGCA